MKNKIKKYNLKIDEGFFDFINNEVLPGTQIDKDFFWNNFVCGEILLQTRFHI